MTADAGLAEITARFRAGAGLTASTGPGPAPPGGDPAARLIAAIEGNTAATRQHMAMLRMKAAAAWPIEIPAMPYTVTAAGALAPGTGLAGSAHVGPVTGYFWDLTRVTIDGLTPGGGTPAQAEGQVTSPGAGATIAQITAANLAPGTYTVHWAVELDGTVSATDIDNFRLFLGSTALLTSINDGAVGRYGQVDVQITVPTPSVSLRVQSIAAGTVGAIYSAQISVVPIPSDQVTLYKTSSGIASGQKRLHTFVAEGPGTVGDTEWTPGKGTCMMRAGDALLLTGTGLAASQVLLSGEAIMIEAPWIGEYLL